MDLTPETLRSATFRDKLRGYHPDDVDEFLESVARGLEVLLARLRDASERARSAAVSHEPPPEADEAVRTLSLAQRTADLAIHEAKAEAERLVQAAEHRAHKVVGDAEETAVAVAEAAQVELRADLEKLQAARDQLSGEVTNLGAWLTGERERIRRALTEVADRVGSVREPKDGPAVRPPKVPQPPRQKLEVTRAKASAPAPPVAPAPPRPAPAPPQQQAAPQPAPPVEERPAPEPPVAKTPLPPPPAAAPAPQSARQPTPPGGQPAISVQADRPDLDPPDPSPVPEPADADVLQRAQAQMTSQHDDDRLDDDPYFAELRRAMTDETPLGPREDDWNGSDTSSQPRPGQAS